MPDGIGSIGALKPLAMPDVSKLTTPSATPTSGSGSFLSAFNEAVSNTNSKLNTASDLQSLFAAGGDVDPAEVAVATEEASLAVELLVQLRNKVTEGFNDLLHTNV